MAGSSPPKKPSVSKTPQKVLKCTVQLNIKAVTCPGVLLPSHHDIYLSVCVLGQFHKTNCLPPIFPLLFHEKMVFQKTFAEAVDPSDVAELLEFDTTCFELIQLIPPEGEILATVEQNSRDFLYPDPTLSPRSSSHERKILMNRSSSFPGISPRVEFSTTSIIQDCSLKAQAPMSTPSSEKTRCSRRAAGVCRPELKAKQQAGPTCSYERPTVASQTRSLSPYTHRRMCQLSEDTRQRLSHLQLGPFKFKKESESLPPFVVPRMLSSSTNESSVSHHTSSPKSFRRSWAASSTVDHTDDPSLLGSYRPKLARGHRSSLKERRSPGEASRHRHTSPPTAGFLAAHSTPLSGVKITQSPLLSRSSLRERFQNGPSSPACWEEIHRRVQRILRTHSARMRLSFDDLGSHQHTPRRRPYVPCDNSLCDGQDLPDSERAQREFSGHLNSDAFWSKRAAQYTGQSRRAVFEDSLGRVYKDLYNSITNTS
ncbi:spermatogenesis-associated protein 6 [Scleropages formosus]|uniref:Spermatogenesis associated 6 n=1 Tax=Scleropages formosus TaxID=113540 RepID=A0A8D0CJX5_SCLFO|nr:spermatogenesis-associated protein 6 [Scleropages formosus]